MDFTTLGSLIEKHGGVIQTGPFGSQLHQHEYVENGIPVIMPKDIQNGRVDESTVARISEQKAQELSRHILKAGSIVFPRRGEINKCAYISEAQAGFLCGTGCLKIEVPSDILSPKFLFYYLGLRHVVEWLEKNAVGTTMLNLNTSIVGGLSVPLIDKNQQDRIVDILSAYDDLIENNRRRIDLLEQSARMLYKEWFVSLRFPGHEHVKVKDGVPQGWEKTTLGEIAPLNYGKSLKADERIPGEFPVYGSSGIVGTHEKALVPGPGIIVGRKGNAGSAFWSMTDFYPIDTTYYIESSNSNYFVYYLLLNTQFVSSDVAVPGLNRDYAHSLNIVLPDKNLLSLFEEMVSPIHKQIYTLEKSTEAITTARDLLLPRLMNGEIPV